MFDDPATANARTLGSKQNDAMQRLSGGLGWVGRTATSQSASGIFSDSPFNTIPVGNSGATGGSSSITFDNAYTARTSSETRGTNAAYAPRIHV